MHSSDSEDDLPDLVDIRDSTWPDSGGEHPPTTNDPTENPGPRTRIPGLIDSLESIPLHRAAVLIFDPSSYNFDDEPIFLWDSYSGGSSSGYRAGGDTMTDEPLVSLRCKIASRPDGSQNQPTALSVEVTGAGDMLEVSFRDYRVLGTCLTPLQLHLPLSFRHATSTPYAVWMAWWADLHQSPIYCVLYPRQKRALYGICTLMALFSEDTPTTRAVWPSCRVQLLFKAQVCSAGIPGEILLLDLCQWAADLPDRPEHHAVSTSMEFLYMFI